MNIRFATLEDTAAILAIYEQYINTTVTFEYTLPSYEEFQERIAHISCEYPYLVWEEDGKVLGYAYSHKAMERAAYQWNAEFSIYLDNSQMKKGVGKAMYEILIDISKLQGVKNALGVITEENTGSCIFHERLGFTKFATYRKTGYKNGKWLDVNWYEKELDERLPDPTPIIPIRELPMADLLAIIEKHTTA